MRRESTRRQPNLLYSYGQPAHEFAGIRIGEVTVAGSQSSDKRSSRTACRGVRDRFGGRVSSPSPRTLGEASGIGDCRERVGVRALRRCSGRAIRNRGLKTLTPRPLPEYREMGGDFWTNESVTHPCRVRRKKLEGETIVSYSSLCTFVRVVCGRDFIQRGAHVCSRRQQIYRSIFGDGLAHGEVRTLFLRISLRHSATRPGMRSACFGSTIKVPKGVPEGQPRKLLKNDSGTPSNRSPVPTAVGYSHRWSRCCDGAGLGTLRLPR